MAPPNLETFLGRYLGFSPTDESNIGMGEMEMTITVESITIRMATGRGIQEEVINISEFDIVAPEETLKKLSERGPVENISSNNVVGEFRHKRGVPILIFLRESGEGIDGVLMTGTMGDLLGPTVLCSQAQVDNGVFDEFLDKLEKEYGKDQFPRLAYDGKASKNIQDE